MCSLSWAGQGGWPKGQGKGGGALVCPCLSILSQELRGSLVYAHLCVLRDGVREGLVHTCLGVLRDMVAGHEYTLLNILMGRRSAGLVRSRLGIGPM